VTHPHPPRAQPALSDLLAAVPAPARRIGPPGDPALRDVTHDSRAAGPGVLFAARPGATADGHDFAPAAVAAGSPALLVERPLGLDVPQLLVPSVAAALGPVASRVHGDPSSALTLLGVTGTNGKTTTAFLLESALRSAGHRTGLLGTVETRVGGRRVEGIRTTPEASDLQRLLAGMVGEGVTAAAMEVSSHGLALGRVDGTRFAAVAFTNLSQDHLDFHRDLADYEAAKTRLFTPGFAPVAAVVVDGAAGERVARAAAAAGLRVLRVSTEGAVDAAVTARDVRTGPTGSTFTAVVDGRAAAVAVRLPGHFNVANALLALATADAAGVDLDAAVAGVGELEGVPGRMEAVDAGQPFAVLVDYAHTPEAVESVLSAARRLTTGRVLVVVGCGGDRDGAKRPLMGAAAVRLADGAFLTSDNPRSEDPLAVLGAMVAGARTVPGGAWTVEPDRRAAIAAALAAARPGDVVVIAGKGHETYQEVAGVRLPFDDRAVARELLGAVGDLRAPGRSGSAVGSDPGVGA